jgi:hypothetical protein
MSSMDATLDGDGRTFDAIAKGRIRMRSKTTPISLASGAFQARASQILKLETLAPSIQEHILWLLPRVVGKEGITERDVRCIVSEPRWDRQCLLFEKLRRRFGDPL